jgi:NAD-dependent deacetylase
MTPLDTIRNAAKRFLAGKKRVALTGAGISVDCGIPDFRGQQGIWQRFNPDEYATIEAFFSHPEKAWHFYRCLGDVVLDRSPGAAHRALAELERGGWIDGVVTQNIDSLHTAAGSRQVLEIHGNFQQLQCCYCHELEPAERSVLSQEAIPRCSHCGERLKPNIVLFGESVRELAAVERWISECDTLLLIGTSGSVFPVADLPLLVHARGGLLIEFNIDETPLSSYCDFRLPGRAEQTVPAFEKAVSDLKRG